MNLAIRPGLFGGTPRNQTQKSQSDSPRGKVYFMGRDYNSALAFLDEIGVTTAGFWECIHTFASCEGITKGRVYVCPGADEKPDFREIMDYLSGKHMQIILMYEVKTWEVQ